MGRLFATLLLAGGAWFAANHVGISLDPRSVGTSVEGRRVVRNAEDVAATFDKVGRFEATYMLFGGNAERQRNSLIHALVAGLPIRHARLIAASHPDFYMCKSPGAAQAQNLTEDVSFVAANRGARSELARAVKLFHERIRGDGERTCIQVSGAPLLLDSVRVKQNGEDLTAQLRPALERSQLVLAERVEIQDCRSLMQ